MFHVISLKRKCLLYTLPTELNKPKETELCIYCKIIYIYKNMIVITEFTNINFLNTNAMF